MRILYFSFVELDIPNACRTHTLGILKGFIQNGCRVDAVLPRPKMERPKIPSVRFYYIWPWRFSILGKWWVKNLCGWYFFILCLLRKYEAIYIRELENYWVPRVLSKLFGIPLFLEINDLLPVYFKDIGCSERYILKIIKSQFLDFKQASGLIANSMPMKNWIEANYPITVGKVKFIMNGGEEQNENCLNRSKVLGELERDENGFYLGFVGTIYGRFDLITPIKSVAMLGKMVPNFKFIIIGDGPNKSDLQKYVRKHQLTDQVIFTGFIEENQLDRYLPTLDLAIIPLTQRSTENYGSLPTKFATYASFKLPVVTTESNLNGYPEEIKKWVLMYQAECPDDLMRLLYLLYENKRIREESARQLNQYFINNLTWKSVAQRIVEAMSD